MKPGDIVLVALLQADGRNKNRPAVLLKQMPPYGDWLVCGVSTQLHQCVPGFDDIVARADADYAASGLLAESVIRLGFLAVLPARELLGSIGAVAADRHARLLKRLSDYLVQ